MGKKICIINLGYMIVVCFCYCNNTVCVRTCYVPHHVKYLYGVLSVYLWEHVCLCVCAPVWYSVRVVWVLCECECMCVSCAGLYAPVWFLVPLLALNWCSSMFSYFKTVSFFFHFLLSYCFYNVNLVIMRIKIIFSTAQSKILHLFLWLESGQFLFF